MELSLELEAISLLIIGLLALFHLDKNARRNKRYNFFNCALCLTGSAIFLNIVSCLQLEHFETQPIWSMTLLNSLYFIAIISCFSWMAIYAFYLLFEYAADDHCFKIASRIIKSFYAVLMVLVILNVWTGCYFYFDENGYQRGPLNKIAFVALFVEIGMFCVCYIRNQKVASPYIRKMVTTLPPVIAGLMVMQLLMPDVLMTGTIATFASLIFFVCFQNNRIGRDALTEVQNRSSFFREIEYFRKKGKSAHVILVQLKQFDKINKKFGTKGGDGLMFNVARYLDNFIDGYHVYRFGNTKFIILGELKSLTQAEEVVGLLHRRFEEPWAIKNNKWYLRCHLAHTTIGAKDVDENLLIEQLEYLISCVEHEEENQILFFDEEHKSMFERKNYVLTEVKKAIKEEAFKIYYQPVYSCKEKRFVTAEALLRLVASDGNMISPGEFIPLAEENGLIDDISWLVLKKCCQFISENIDMPLDSISMNMSIQQLDVQIFDKIVQCKRDFDFPAKKLRIEITERLITENQTMAIEVMKNLTSGGICFYLDDFGVGYSNFAGMMNLPFEAVKLDRSLVKSIAENQKDYQTVKYIVKMLHNAGFVVVAEGLETKEQVEHAEKLHIDRIQGFYYAKPMPQEELLKFIEEHNEKNF